MEQCLGCQIDWMAVEVDDLMIICGIRLDVVVVQKVVAVGDLLLMLVAGIRLNFVVQMGVEVGD